MKLYHGGLVEIKVPRIIVRDHIGDFGAGFYTTTGIQQARRFVKTKCAREMKTSGIVSIFDVRDDFLRLPDLRIRVFRKADEDWAHFVEANRRNPDYEHDFELVFVPVDNDQVYASFALYESELIDFAELVNRLKARKLTDQVLFHTEKALSLLEYAGSEVVRCPHK